jgi:energy-coupling factor transporter ATP-binding protein EcfA2
MKPANLLEQHGLARNPFTDRTAENTQLDQFSLYEHSDLQHFKPSNRTYVFFGKRGAGKTTVRMAMQRAYEQANEELIQDGGEPHFVVDLCRPGHMTACLKDFQVQTHSSQDNWDAAFKKNWTLDDLLDCIICYAMNKIVALLTAEDETGKKHAAELAAKLRSNGKVARQVLVLTALYARTDQATLHRVRRLLQPWSLMSGALLSWLSSPAALFACSSLACVTLVGSAVYHVYSNEPGASSRHRGSDSSRFNSRLRGPAGIAEALDERPGLTGGVAVASVACAATGLYARARHVQSKARAIKLQSYVRVVKHRPVDDVATILDCFVPGNDDVETIRSMQIGISAHQKLDKLLDIVKHLGYQSLPVFGDCFDEVTFLDPVLYPEALKTFAGSVCRNDLLNFGRMHFFLPGDRMSLDLTTDTVVKEARFDRHFVRDMAWSRHQLTQLAERRFHAAQQRVSADGSVRQGVSKLDGELTAFSDLLKEVSGEDFAAIVGKLTTPRELLIMMTNVFNRLERNPPGAMLTAKDMEAAVEEAIKQSG